MTAEASSRGLVVFWMELLRQQRLSEFIFSQVFEEEHHILYLDHGGVIVAIKDTSIPLKILKYVLRFASTVSKVLASALWSTNLPLMLVGVTEN